MKSKIIIFETNRIFKRKKIREIFIKKYSRRFGEREIGCNWKKEEREWSLSKSSERKLKEEEKRKEKERQEKEEQERLEQERLEQERIEKERQEKEEQERKEREKLEKELNQIII